MLKRPILNSYIGAYNIFKVKTTKFKHFKTLEEQLNNKLNNIGER
jgi:hypothetical protein